MTKQKNLNGEELEPCSLEPLTGYLRDGYCRYSNDDNGLHTVCAKMDSDFLNYTASKGNDLSSVVKPGQKWCLCQNRWDQAYNDGVAPNVILESTNNVTNEKIKRHILLRSSSLREKKKKSQKNIKGGRPKNKNRHSKKNILNRKYK